MNELTFHRVADEDVETVADILEEAGRWLAERGIEQWLTKVDREQIRQRLAYSEVYLAEVGGHAIGTLSLQEEDRMIWGLVPPDALYVHSLAIRRIVAGQKIGRRMLDWAAEQAAKRGKRYLRLDCVAANATLRAYYERNNFTPRGIGQIGTSQFALFERLVAETPA